MVREKVFRILVEDGRTLRRFEVYETARANVAFVRVADDVPRRTGYFSGE